MDRLTEYIGEGEYRVAKPKNSIPACQQRCFEKLADYEDAEENGLLVRLPCKLGTKVFWVGKTVKEKEFWESFDVFEKPFEYSDIPDFGKTVFLTQAEAEAKLKEMEGEYGEM